MGEPDAIWFQILPTDELLHVLLHLRINFSNLQLNSASVLKCLIDSEFVVTFLLKWFPLIATDIWEKITLPRLKQLWLLFCPKRKWSPSCLSLEGGGDCLFLRGLGGQLLNFGVGGGQFWFCLGRYKKTGKCAVGGDVFVVKVISDLLCLNCSGWNFEVMWF